MTAWLPVLTGFPSKMRHPLKCHFCSATFFISRQVFEHDQTLAACFSFLMRRTVGVGDED